MVGVLLYNEEMCVEYLINVEKIKRSNCEYGF